MRGTQTSPQLRVIVWDWCKALSNCPPRSSP